MGCPSHMAARTRIPPSQQASMVKEEAMMVNIQQNHIKVFGSQYIADTMNFGNVTNRTEFSQQLQNVKDLLPNVNAGGELTDDQMKEVDYNIGQAITEANKPQPDKNTVTSFLEKAKNVVTGIATMATLAVALEKAVEVAHHLL
jgi:hypothetical protein